MFSHSVDSTFILLIVRLFCCVKAYKFDVVSFVYFFSFASLARGDISAKILLQEMSEILVPMFSLAFLWLHDLHFGLLSILSLFLYML